MVAGQENVKGCISWGKAVDEDAKTHAPGLILEDYKGSLGIKGMVSSYTEEIYS